MRAFYWMQTIKIDMTEVASYAIIAKNRLRLGLVEFGGRRRGFRLQGVGDSLLRCIDCANARRPQIVRTILRVLNRVLEAKFQRGARGELRVRAAAAAAFFGRGGCGRRRGGGCESGDLRFARTAATPLLQSAVLLDVVATERPAEEGVERERHKLESGSNHRKNAAHRAPQPNVRPRPLALADGALNGLRLVLV